jgi:hypothetical protein
MRTQSTLRTLAFLFMLHVVTSVSAQFAPTNFPIHQTYTATRNGKEIGWLKISSFNNNSDHFLTTESNLVVQMLFSFEAKAIVMNKFTGNVLTQAGVHRTINGKVKLDNAVQLTGGKYNIIKGDADQPISKPIVTTVTSLYFKEPVGITEVFSEVYLCFLQIKKTAPSVYETSLPDGGLMTYSYTHGNLTHITAKTTYGTVHFELKK